MEPTPPILIVEGLDVQAFSSVQDAQSYLEPWWVQEGQGRVYDAHGRRLIAACSGQRVSLSLDSDSPPQESELALALRAHLRPIGKPDVRDDSGLPELVAALTRASNLERMALGYNRTRVGRRRQRSNMSIQEDDTTGSRITAPVRFFSELGNLHDATVVDIHWNTGKRVVMVTIDDLYANFAGLPEYVGLRPARVCMADVRRVRLEAPSDALPLRIMDFEVAESADSPGLHISVTFVPSGSLRIECGSVATCDTMS